MIDFEKLYVGEKTFTSSEFQKDIFKEIASGVGNMVITAAAGSAKTTTIENCLRFIPEDKRKLFLAFNVSTVEKLKSEIVDANGVRIMTFHGLGNRILRENEVEFDVDDFKYVRYVKNHIEELTEFKECRSLGMKVISYLTNIVSLIDYSRYYLAMRVRDIQKVAEIYGIVPERDEFEVVRKVLIWGKNNTKLIDHTDMIWLPNVLNMTTKRYLFDFIFIDEAQDTTLAHQALVDKCFKRGCRFVAVGDPRQQINVWCGATEQSIQNYLSRPDTKHKQLPISYRCPRKVIEMAKKFAPEITERPDAIDGIVRQDVSPNDARPGDLVLCRIMSKLIEQYMSYIRNNKKAFLKGSDGVKDTYLSLINSVEAEKIDPLCITKNGLIPKLYELYFDRLDTIMKSLEIGEAEAMYHYELLNLYDNIEAIKVMSEGLTTVDELRDKVKVIFNGDDQDAIILSTVHKAKGLEADNVFILCPSLLPSRLAQKDWEIQAEKNLVYVAITRAKKTLNFIHEDEKGFFNNFKSVKNMEDELANVRLKIEYVKKVHEIAAGTRTPEETEPKEATGEEEKPKNTKKGGLKFANLIKKG